MTVPQIIAPDYGKHNQMMDESIRRLDRMGVYKDLSTIVIVPAFGTVPTKCVASWRNLLTPPNQKVYWMWALGMEVGEAYSQSIQNILNHPDLSKWKYILTLEHDNVPPPDGLVLLLESMEAHPEYSGISSLYFTKGEGGVPQIWGDPKDTLNFRPQKPVPGQLVECCGTGMGFGLWRLDLFKDSKLRKPWFKTVAGMVNNGVQCYTQDLYFCEDAKKNGHRFAVDCRVLTGHHDVEANFTW
jgi:hypothetical protein